MKQENKDYCDNCEEYITQIELKGGSFGCPICKRDDCITTFYKSDEEGEEITPKKISFGELKKSLQNKEVMTTIFYPDKTKEIKTSDFMIYKDYKAKLIITKGFMFDIEAEFFKDDDEEFKAVCKDYRIQFNIKRTERRLSE